MIVRIRFCWTDEGHKNHTKKAKMIEKCDKKAAKVDSLSNFRKYKKSIQIYYNSKNLLIIRLLIKNLRPVILFTTFKKYHPPKWQGPNIVEARKGQKKAFEGPIDFMIKGGLSNSIKRNSKKTKFQKKRR